jgi:hypothetical protein
MGDKQSILGTETVLLSLDREHAAERMVLRRAHATSSIVSSSLVKGGRPVRIIDYSECFRDGSFEIAITVTAASQARAENGVPISRPASTP